MKDGITIVQVVQYLTPITLEALNFSFADNGATLFGANGEPINSGAAINGQGTDYGPYQATGYLTPTPEPSSLILLATGAVGSVGTVRRRFFHA